MNAKQEALSKELKEWRAKLLTAERELDKIKWNIKCIEKEMNETL